MVSDHDNDSADGDWPDQCAFRIVEKSVSTKFQATAVQYQEEKRPNEAVSAAEDKNNHVVKFKITGTFQIHR